MTTVLERYGHRLGVAARNSQWRYLVYVIEWIWRLMCVGILGWIAYSAIAQSPVSEYLPMAAVIVGCFVVLLLIIASVVVWPLTIIAAVIGGFSAGGAGALVAVCVCGVLGVIISVMAAIKSGA